MNEGSKYPITGGDRQAIRCGSHFCAGFGKGVWIDLGIYSDSNNNTDSECFANKPSFKLPPAKGKDCEEGSSSINGGKSHFKSKEFEVYRVFVRIILIKILFKLWFCT